MTDLRKDAGHAPQIPLRRLLGGHEAIGLLTIPVPTSVKKENSEAEDVHVHQHLRAIRVQDLVTEVLLLRVLAAFQHVRQDVFTAPFIVIRRPPRIPWESDMMPRGVATHSSGDPDLMHLAIWRVMQFQKSIGNEGHCVKVMMNASNSGAVFFLGTRAHYQVLQQPDRPFDVENGNASTETIYQNSTAVNELWNKEQTDSQNNEVEYTGEHSNWGYSEAPEVIVNDNKDTGVKRRAKRRPSETALCEEQDIRPAQLNATPDRFEHLVQYNLLTILNKFYVIIPTLNVTFALSTPKAKGGRRRVSVLGALASLARRKRRLQSHSACYLKRLEVALTTCTYRESCRCFECQSRYFECDEDEYSSEDDEYEYAAQYYASQMVNMCQHGDDDEVFVDTVPDDNTSTDMLLDEPKESSVVSVSPEPEPEPNLELEVAAGTPIVLNYLLTHPITCCVQ
ncbi:hypothetical protein MSG28_015192 [Choristoneura fumiferana]|uniref:Uncharacterized protein n=1 Tax=Choristoneura fumiferana TaxID=7141 RepID=A0ACC0KZ89_CHOFU|nr:hypothetical protein MSG28_015192 [Choristoneura fumiferana]